MSSTTAFPAVESDRTSWDRLRIALVSLIFITSFVVKVEPAPTDYLVVVGLLLFFASGLHFSRYLAPGIGFLMIYLIAGIVGCIPISRPIIFTDANPYAYALGLTFTSSSALLLAGYVAADPLVRYRQIERAYWIGATLGSILGLLLYLRVEPFISFFLHLGNPADSWGSYYNRVVGGYKDPNVFSTWLVLPVVSMFQAFMVGRLKLSLISCASFLVILLALLLAFSRGAWIDAAGATVVTLVLTAIFSPSANQRGRILTVGALAIALTVMMVVILLSIPEIASTFEDRLVLMKSYDSGETGRFGNQLNAIPMLMRLPWGFGPYQFQEIFGIAPHNTFLNSFASGGWIGGLSYLMLTLANIVYGIKAMLTRSPLQPFAIVVFSSFIIMTFQGIQIDDEHWRHLYWMMGIGWGLASAIFETAAAGYTSAEMAEGWSLRPQAD